MSNECPICRGSGIMLGIIGDLLFYTCRDCGIGFHVAVEFERDDE
jgi:hypothetical protein